MCISSPSPCLCFVRLVLHILHIAYCTYILVHQRGKLCWKKEKHTMHWTNNAMSSLLIHSQKLARARTHPPTNKYWPQTKSASVAFLLVFHEQNLWSHYKCSIILWPSVVLLLVSFSRWSVAVFFFHFACSLSCRRNKTVVYCIVERAQ